jgi:hypothetical protein
MVVTEFVKMAALDMKDAARPSVEPRQPLLGESRAEGAGS